MGKKLFKTLLIVCLALAMAVPALAADKVIKWKVQGFVPAGMLFHETLERLAEKVKIVSGGRLIFEIHPAGALVPPLEGIKAVSENVYQANYGYSALWVGKIPVAPLFTAIPGGFNMMGLQMWLEQGDGAKLWQETYDKYGFNVKVMPAHMLAMEEFQWAKKPLVKLDDFKGVKMRMMPLMGDVLQKHGLSVIFVPAGEIMPNLQRGVLDSAEYSIPAFAKTLGIWEVCKYAIVPGFHQPASMTELIINKDAYKALPEDLKVALKAAVAWSQFDEWLWMEKKNMEAIDFMAKKGVKWVRMDPETVKTFTKWANDYLDGRAAKDPDFAKVWNSQKAFAEKWYPYHKNYSLEH